MKERAVSRQKAEDQKVICLRKFPVPCSLFPVPCFLSTAYCLPPTLKLGVSQVSYFMSQ